MAFDGKIYRWDTGAILYTGVSLPAQTSLSACLEEAVNSDSNLMYAMLSGTPDNKENLRNLSLSGAWLTNAHIFDCDFYQTDLSNCDLDNSVITGCSFKKCNFTNSARFEYSEIKQ